MDKFEGYNKPWIMRRADPYVYRHTDGSYYFTASLPEYDGIALRRADTLYGLKDAEEIRIWNKHTSGIMSFHIWAPELHYLDGKWYIYFAGTNTFRRLGTQKNKKAGHWAWYRESSKFSMPRGMKDTSEKSD